MLVVVDGSDDGTREMVSPAALDHPVPLTAEWQPNAGLAAARDRGLEAATGELAWFLDDDMLPHDGLVARDRAAHRERARRLVMGPCLPPAGLRVVRPVREWAEYQYARVARRRGHGPALFFAANTSGPVTLWREIGGFDPRLVGWGGEDYEIAVRLLAAGVPIAYEPEAIAWHEARQVDLHAFEDRERCGEIWIRHQASVSACREARRFVLRRLPGAAAADDS